MENFNSLLLHTITCGKSLRQKRRNIWVRPTNTKRLEFGILSPFLEQLVSRRWLCIFCFYVHRGRGITDCLVVLNWKNLPFERQVAVTAHDHRNPTDEHETCRLKTLESAKLVGLDSTRLCGYAPLQWTWILRLWRMLGLTFSVDLYSLSLCQKFTPFG